MDAPFWVLIKLRREKTYIVVVNAHHAIRVCDTLLRWVVVAYKLVSAEDKMMVAKTYR